MSRVKKIFGILIAAILIISVFALSPNIKANNFSREVQAVGTEVDSMGQLRESLKEAVIMYIGSSAAIINGNKVLIDDKYPEITPIIHNGIVFIPLRITAEGLGWKVGWDGKTSSITAILGKKTIKFRQGSDIITTDGVQSKINTPVMAVKGRTFVSLTEFVEVLGVKFVNNQGLIVIGENENLLNTEEDKAAIQDLISRIGGLPVVGSFEKLVELLETFTQSGPSVVMRGELPRISSEVSLGNTDDKTTASKSESNASTAASKATAVIAGTESSQVSYDGSGSTDHSTTNVQVEGVDEGDIIKTDGKYIYQVNRERVVVAKAYPAQDMKIESMITFRDEEFYPLEMYLDENKLVVVGNSSTSVKVFIFDISNKSDIKQIRNFEIEGAYISSRKIGSYLYMVANKYADYYYIMQNESANPTPVYRDSASGDDFLDIDLKQVCYFPGHIQPNYMIVAGINVDKVDEKAHISTFLGSGQNIYSSLENLYIAVTDYNVINKTEVKNDKKPKAEVSETTVESSVGNSTAVTTKPSIAIDMRPNISQENTLIYKFYLNNGIATYICKGNVPGRILNQFSMDEHNRYFRIATTTGEIWRNDEFTSKNNIYVLDDMLNIKGKVLDIAPGEQIYSVRFMGDRAYMVTFKLTDPLFVIDLKNPQEPRILGALKIPGYSDYLHPYDENHIIGFGKDSVEVKGQAFYMGMKIAMFDVSDVSNPIQEFSEIIGDRGTDSELLRNHKALLFSKEKGLMAFPVTVMEINSENKFAHGGFPNYGQFAFQGAYVYNVDPVKGFTLRGKITHLDRDDMLRAGSGWYSSDKNINRIIYIDDTLYTLSNKILKANGLDDMKEKSQLEIP